MKHFSRVYRLFGVPRTEIMGAESARNEGGLHYDDPTNEGFMLIS